MEKFVLAIGVAGLVALLLLVLPLVGTVFGALSGWVVGLLFSETILGFFTALGITGLKMWQIGASLGFIGGFFKATQTNDK